MRTSILAVMIAAVALPAVPAMAQTPQQANRDYNRDLRDAERDRNRDLRRADDRRDVNQANREYRRDIRDARQDRRRDVREARQDRRRDVQDWRQYRNYDYNRLPQGQQRYYADRYYREGNYQQRRLGPNDRIYAGQDNRYYCRRNDGTTGLIVGGLGGGVLGNVIAPGNSGLLGTILGAVGGGVLGRSVDRNQVNCR